MQCSSKRRTGNAEEHCTAKLFWEDEEFLKQRTDAGEHCTPGEVRGGVTIRSADTNCGMKIGSVGVSHTNVWELVENEGSATIGDHGLKGASRLQAVERGAL